MNSVRYALSALLLVGLVGCNKSEKGGGTDSAHSFTMSGPTMATTVKQGETQTVDISLSKGKEFKQGVTFKVEAPTGIEADTTEKTIKASDPGKVGLKITATDKATVGEHTIVVTGTPESGTATTLKVNVKVAARGDGPKNESSSLSIKGPLLGLATKIKQGETQTIDLSLSGTHTGDVGLKVEPAGKGIKTELTSNTIKAGDTGKVGLKVTAEKDAALGEHTIRVTGSRDSGSVQAADIRINVVAP